MSEGHSPSDVTTRPLVRSPKTIHVSCRNHVAGKTVGRGGGGGGARLEGEGSWTDIQDIMKKTSQSVKNRRKVWNSGMEGDRRGVHTHTHAIDREYCRNEIAGKCGWGVGTGVGGRGEGGRYLSTRGHPAALFPHVTCGPCAIFLQLRGSTCYFTCPPPPPLPPSTPEPPRDSPGSRSASPQCQCVATGQPYSLPPFATSLTHSPCRPRRDRSPTSGPPHR